MNDGVKIVAFADGVDKVSLTDIAYLIGECTRRDIQTCYVMSCKLKHRGQKPPQPTRRPCKEDFTHTISQSRAGRR